MARRVVSPVVVGREPELALLETARVEAGAGGAQVVLVGGEAGVGKTRLVAELTDRAGSDGWLVLQGACLDLGEGDLPLAPIVEALRSLPARLGPERSARVLGPALDGLSGLVPTLTEGPVSLPFEPSRVLELLLGVVQRLTAEAPTLVVVEDLHWADQSTRDLLAFLAHSVRDERFLLVATYRTDELHRRHPLVPFLADVSRTARPVRIELERLGRDQVGALLRAIRGEAVAADLVDAVYGRSEGNPFMAEELLVASETGTGALPPTLRDTLTARLARCSEAAHAVLRVAAVAGRRVDDVLLGALAGLDDGALLAALRELVDLQVLVPDGDGYRFRHALVQEVVLHDDLLPGEAARLHAAVADHLEASGAVSAVALAERAHHRFAARDVARALGASVAAGRAAARVGALAESARHLERALEVWDQVPDAAASAGAEWIDVCVDAADACRMSGRLDRAVALLRLAVSRVDEQEEPVVAGLLHERLGRALWNADMEGYLEQHDIAERLVPAHPPSPERARVLAGRAQVLMLSARVEEAIPVARAAVEVAVVSGARRVEGHARNTYGACISAEGQAEEGIGEILAALAIAHEVGASDDIGRAYVNLTYSYLLLDRPGEAVEQGIAGIAACRELGTERTNGVYIATNTASALVALGRWEEALAIMLDAQARLPPGFWGYISAAPLLAERGELATARRMFESVSLPDGDAAILQGIGEHTAGRAALHLWEGTPSAVREQATDALARIPARLRLQVGGPLLWRAVWAEADRAVSARADRTGPELDAVLADVRGAADLFVAEGHVGASFGEVVPKWAHGYVALAEAERARVDGPAVDAWEVALAAWPGPWHPFERAYVGYRLAEAVLAGTGDRERAATLLAAARDVSDELGARPLRDAIDVLARRAGLDAADPRPGDGGVAADGAPTLTQREQQVLALVAEGMSNGQIAQRLFISTKTASVHVSNILAKLGVRTRGEAAARAHREGVVDPPA
jgi:DNA-binding CsgD family transcriptional regulator/tetratricopeptide (TPR) repeat protein